ncbi:hypothetical protein LUZ62_014745 [Rhynchospora pubera]|uniref:DUF4220 domain-containing protein n=1 Tax=Rhynchospora pubera TaxID=906938 RepID=A0AAV8GDB9_9POAL|nr:hypothetical protein LUZ62_014745 [Rhynchospora pubera]
MDRDLAPVQPPSTPDNYYTDESPRFFLLAYTCASGLLLLVAFVTVITRFRLWHTSSILKKIPEMVSDPIISLINQGIGFATAYTNQNDIYMIWVLVLIMAYENVSTISSCSLMEQASTRWSRECISLYNCFVAGYLIIKYKGRGDFYPSLLVLWLLLVAKFFIRVKSYVRAERAYGLENANLVSDYMKSEHKLSNSSDAIDPLIMQGYKYLVMGEEKVDPRTEAPDYTTEVELTDHVVTVEKVWSCKERLLHPSVDTEGRLKDVCLSFALFKLLRRRYFGYPAAEAQGDRKLKTRRLLLDGLLCAKAQGEVDKERVFRVIKMEIGFLRDFFFTRYPVGFASGFPILNVMLLGGMLGVTLWIATQAFHQHKYRNVRYSDYIITDALLILLMVIEFFEVFTFVFCDWAKVIIVCRNVRSNFSHVASQLLSSSEASLQKTHISLSCYKVLATLCKLRLSLSVKNTLGQYSLVRNCNKTSLRRSRVRCFFIPTCAVQKSKAPPRGLKKSKAVVLSKYVKNAIFDTLVRSRGELTNGTVALQRCGQSIFHDLQWTLNLATPVHTIMVWHIATSFCAIHPVKEGGNKESIEPDFTVATHLSNYCAYLVAFLPDLLPLTTSNSLKYMLWKVFEETCEFFHRERKLEAKYKMMMSCGDGDGKIIHRGSSLGRYLSENINDDTQRWKMIAEFWSEYILFIVPSGSTRAHIQELGNGSEFITHLWALLYHGGIIDTSSAEYHP